MRKTFLATLALYFGLTTFAFADRITLDTPEAVNAPTAPELYWYVDKIDATIPELVVRYQYKDSLDHPINNPVTGRPWFKWVCRDVSNPQNVADCVGVDDPYPGCTGVRTGPLPEFLDTCFSDIFRFQIRQQDVGTAIGVGLRKLIFHQFKQDRLSPGNDGVFHDN